MEELKIPKERIAVLVGKKGKTKRRIEKLTNTKLKIDSKEGDVFIEGESLDAYTAKNIIHAIGAGFNPKIAELLISEDYAFESLDVRDYARSKKRITALKGRLIGTKGKIWKMIETSTNTRITIHNNFVGLIGLVEDVAFARETIEYILEGAPHSNVRKFLEDRKKKLLQKI